MLNTRYFCERSHVHSHDTLDIRNWIPTHASNEPKKEKMWEPTDHTIWAYHWYERRRMRVRKMLCSVVDCESLQELVDTVIPQKLRRWIGWWLWHCHQWGSQSGGARFCSFDIPEPRVTADYKRDESIWGRETQEWKQVESTVCVQGIRIWNKWWVSKKHVIVPCHKRNRGGKHGGNKGS